MKNNRNRQADRSGRLAALAAGVMWGAAGAYGCSSPLAPDFVLPPESQSIDPAAIARHAPLFTCGRWNAGGPPSADFVLADVIFPPRDGGTYGPPLPAHRRSVERHGGRVLREFLIPVLRIYIAPAHLATLAQENVGSAAYTVPDPARYDWIVFVNLRGAITDSDIGTFVSLGGSVRFRFDQFATYTGWLPNRSINALRSASNISSIEAASEACAIAGIVQPALPNQ